LFLPYCIFNLSRRLSYWSRNTKFKAPEAARPVIPRSVVTPEEVEAMRKRYEQAKSAPPPTAHSGGIGDKLREAIYKLTPNQ